MPAPELTFLSQTGEPEVVTIENAQVEVVTIMVQGPKGDPGVGNVENAILDGGTFN